MPTLKAREVVVSPVVLIQNEEIAALLVQNYSGDDEVSSSPIWELPRIAVKFGEHPDHTLTQGMKQRLEVRGTILGLLSCDSYEYRTYNSTIHSIRIVYIVKQENGVTPILNEQYYKGCKWIRKQDLGSTKIADLDREALRKVFDSDNLLFKGDYHV